jgi:hypothetical protein
MEQEGMPAEAPAHPADGLRRDAELPRDLAKFRATHEAMKHRIDELWVLQPVVGG